MQESAHVPFTFYGEFMVALSSMAPKNSQNSIVSDKTIFVRNCWVTLFNLDKMVKLDLKF